MKRFHSCSELTFSRTPELLYSKKLCADTIFWNRILYDYQT